MRKYFFFLMFVFTVKLLGQPRQPTSIVKTQSPIQLDGVLQPEEWGAIPKFHFLESRPNWGVYDSLTTMQVTFDDRYLYVGAMCKFPKDATIFQRSLVRDSWQGDDWFAFHIDSYGDKQNAFVFSIFPSGNRQDQMVSNDGIVLGNSTFNHSYDMIWEGESFVFDNGWSLEMKIPLSNLRFQPKEDGSIVIGISSARSIISNNALYVFPESMHRDIENAIMRPSLKYQVEVDGVDPKKQLMISPYLSLGKQYSKPDQTAWGTIDAGLDVRSGLSSKMTLDLTYDTDFSQVEADDQQINLSRFSLFFPEKRRFFQEQSGLYEMNLGGASQLFYSRNIGINNGQLIPVLGGARINGKVGTSDIGALYMRTQSTTLDTTHLSPENFGVLRVRNKVLNNRSFIGVMGTVRNRQSNANSSIGVDALINLGDQTYFQGAVALTESSAVEEEGLLQRGLLNLQLYNQVTSGWIYSVAYNHTGSYFNPALGFLERSNFQQYSGSIAYGKNNDSGEGFLQSWKLTPLASDVYFNSKGNSFETWNNYSSFAFRTFKGESFELTHVRERQSLSDSLRFSSELTVLPGTYGFNYLFFNYNPAPQRRVTQQFSASLGTFYNGTRSRLSYEPTININKHVNVSASWNINKVKLNGVDETIHLTRFKLNLAANLHLSGSMSIQYNSLTRSWYNNARLRYNFRDGHDIYLVYNDILNATGDYNEMMDSSLYRRTIIFKYIYTFYR